MILPWRILTSPITQMCDRIVWLFFRRVELFFFFNLFIFTYTHVLPDEEVWYIIYYRYRFQLVILDTLWFCHTFPMWVIISTPNGSPITMRLHSFNISPLHDQSPTYLLLLRPPLKSLFPVQRVAKIMYYWAAANFWIFCSFFSLQKITDNF